MVPGNEKTAQASIPEGESEDTIEALDAIDAPLFIAMDDDFGIRICFESMAVFDELFPQFDVVVYLAVENKLHGVVFVRDGLGAAFNIYDTQPSMPQAYLSAKKFPDPVRPT